MASDLIREQAAEVTALFPKIMRRMFMLDLEDPASDLPVAQLRVCGILLDGPRTISCISKELCITLSATTQLADRLEKAGLVERIAEADDRRVKCLQLTDQGREIMSLRRKKRIDRVEQVLQNLTSVERETIVLVLRGLFEAGLTTQDTASHMQAADDIIC